MATLVIQGTVEARRDTSGDAVSGDAVSGYAVDGRMQRRLKIAPTDGARALVVPAGGTARVGADGRFRLEIGGEGDPLGPVELAVSAPDGTRVLVRNLTLEEAARSQRLRVTAVELRTVAPNDDPTTGPRATLSGRVVDVTGRPVAARLPVVLWGVARGADAGRRPEPLVVAETQHGGQFSAPWRADQLGRAEARVAGRGPVPIRLDTDGRLPRNVLLVLDLADVEGPDGKCACGDVPPRAPEPADLTANPAAFSQDLGGGCVDLTTPNRTIEEFTYRFVLRTTEPRVKGLTLEARRPVPPDLLGDLLGTAITSDMLRPRAAAAAAAPSADVPLTLDVYAARHLVRGDRAPSVAAVGRAAWLSEVTRIKDLIAAGLGSASGRTALDADHAIDWDETPTIHQAIELAHGHVLHMREVWRADGFSLGDLLYSLPLGPGQRRRIAVVDWERQSSAIRTEALEFEEQLDAFVGRDRDIREIVGSDLREDTAGASFSRTWGSAGGIGLGFIGSGFGIFGGVAGGASGSSASAWQQSTRTFSADSLQTLRDRVTQRSSALRDQRSTVVQATTQGETLRAETEVVANYNRCHSITVEYFEVLRHFLVTHEVADVTECLFVPLPMAPFDRGKALRWREPLQRYLRDRTLLDGFNAVRRVADAWVGWDYPESRYSEEAPESLEGELRISFVLPRPRDAADGAFQVDMWRPYRGLLDVDALELWTANLSQLAARERDRHYRTSIAPRIAERLVQRLRFAYVTNSGGDIEVPLDPTLVSRYAEGVPLYVTLNPRGAIPAVPREDVTHFRVWYDGDDLPPDARVIVHSGKVRYRTLHLSGLLFAADRILDDLRARDAVVVATPVSRWELRDPRAEDLELADRLVAHLNSHLEYYHQAIWASLDAQRRYMLLDGIIVPALAGRSVASVCSNELIGIVGNSLVLPVAPGQRLDPTIDVRVDEDSGPPPPLLDAYKTNPLPPTRVSVPTRGVYAEAVPGECNACEGIDDARYWRWSTDGLLEPPQLLPVSTETRGSDEPDVRPTPLPSPLVSIQNAPEVPNPASLGDAFGLLATRQLFADITGLEGSQRNAMAAFEASMSAAAALGSEAAKLAGQNELGRNAGRMLDRIDQARRDGLLTPAAAQELARSTLQGLVGEARPSAAPPTADPAVQRVVDEAAQSSRADIRVSSPSETVEVSFDDVAPVVGAGPPIGQLDLDAFVTQPAIFERLDFMGIAGSRSFARDRVATLADLRSRVTASHVASLTGTGFLRADPADASRFQVMRKLRIVYPATPANANRLRGGRRMPVVVLVHGNHEWHDGAQHVPSHEGYTYLQQELAAHGIVSVSVDTNAANALGSYVEMRAELALGALDALRQMDGDPASRFHRRLDFGRVGMMGHSRGGDAVVRAASLNTARPAPQRFGVRAVCALAPTDFTGTTTPASVHRVSGADAPFFAVLYGGLDGDVAGFGGASDPVGTGFRHYDRATTQKAMVFLELCNHNRFNDVWTTDDPCLIAADVGRLLSRADHRRLANEYIGGLFRWRLLGTAAPRALFDGSAANVVGAGAALQWSFGRDVRTLDDCNNPASATLGTRTLRGAIVGEMSATVIAGVAVDERTNHQTGVLAVSPNVPGPPPEVYRLDLPAAHRDWTGFDQFTFRVCADGDVASQAAVAANALPDFDLVFLDGAGGSAVVPAAALRTPARPRRPVFHEATNPVPPPPTENCTVIRLETLAIDLASLAGVDRSQVVAVAVVPPVGFPATQFFDSFQLVRR